MTCPRRHPPPGTIFRIRLGMAMSRSRVVDHLRRRFHRAVFALPFHPVGRSSLRYPGRVRYSSSPAYLPAWNDQTRHRAVSVPGETTHPLVEQHTFITQTPGVHCMAFALAAVAAIPAAYHPRPGGGRRRVYRPAPAIGLPTSSCFPGHSSPLTAGRPRHRSRRASRTCSRVSVPGSFQYGRSTGLQYPYLPGSRLGHAGGPCSSNPNPRRS